MALFGKDLDLPSEEVFDPLLERPGVAVIGKQVDQAREVPHQRPQEQACSVSIAEIGGMNQDGQDQALGINEQVPFATEDFFFRRRSRVLDLARDWF